MRDLSVMMKTSIRTALTLAAVLATGVYSNVQVSAGNLNDKATAGVRFVKGNEAVDVLVDGTTDQGNFRIAVSWTEGLANLVSATDGTETIESKNGLTQTLRVSSSQLRSLHLETGMNSYGEAVGAALDEFFQLENWKQQSVLATAAQSVVLTDLLSLIDSAARNGGL